MQQTKLLYGTVIALTLLFLGLQVMDLMMWSTVVRGLILPFLIVLYCTRSKEKSSYFFWFLVSYATAEALGMLEFLAVRYEAVNLIRYFGGNICYILAYGLLILEVVKSMDLNKLFKKYYIHIAILFAMDVYCVAWVSRISWSSDYFTKSLPDIFIEVLYNGVIMLLLSFTLLNYISKDSKKAMNLLLGTLAFVISEVLQVAYFYVTDERNILGTAYTILLVVAFVFLYMQSGMTYVSRENYRIYKQANA